MYIKVNELISLNSASHMHMHGINMKMKKWYKLKNIKLFYV